MSDTNNASNNGNQGRYSMIPQSGEKNQHASGPGATLGDNYAGSAKPSITATMGIETTGTAGVSVAGTGPNQPERGMTQHERDDLLLGVGSQFGSVSTSHVCGSSARWP